ncbi:TPA: hypothetical protein ACXJEO_000007 [Serratia marcescens]|uniref:hypothetical protein n=1 Tax=Serratia bockelmannii TaxID=2703793 RepID=UPI0029D1B268|nr:hypothetical protein [Serratia marcescens]
MANNKNHIFGIVEKGYARIRVGDRGGAYIPSEEIAMLPEVQDMQKRAAAIVGRKIKINGEYNTGQAAGRKHISVAKNSAVKEQGLEQKDKAKA